MASSVSSGSLLAAGGMFCATLGGIQAFAPAPGGVTSPRLRSHGLQAYEQKAAPQTAGQSANFLATGVAVGALAAAVATASARQRVSRTTTGGARAPPVRGRRVVVAAGATGGKKRVLVMGGTRFIGCYLVKKLRDMGHEVVVCNRGKTNGGKPEALPGMSDADYQAMLSGVSVLVADRKDAAALQAAVAGAGKFDIVFDNNARKLSDVEPLVAGIEATGGCEQYVFMSSAGVYGPTDLLPLSEATPGDPSSRHKEKLSCENYLDTKGFNWTSIRPVYIYGPLNYNPVERFFFDRVARGRPICVPYGGTYITQLGHCEDLAEFMAACIGNPAVSKQAYNLSGEEYVTFDGMARACAEAAGAPPPKIVHYDAKAIDVPEGYPKAFPFRGMHFFASIEKAMRDVPTWRPKFTLLDGLRSSYQSDYVARGFDKKEVDFRTDDLILKSVGAA